MSDLKQKSIEQYFNDFGISDPDEKAKLLPDLTNIIYDRNMHIIWAEKADNDFKRKQTLEGLEEVEKRIKEIFEDFLDKKNNNNPPNPA